MKYAIDNGMIDVAHIQELITMENKAKILKEHPYAIYEGNDGLWYTSLADDSTTMEQMGHKDITTTRKHYYFSNKNDKSKSEQISKAGTKIG